MILRIKNIFKNKFKIKFKAIFGNASIATPVVPAAKVRADWMSHQDKNHKFTQCPGMYDYASAGYIITAHTDIHIKANKAGVVVKLLNADPNLQAKPFDFKLVAGLAKIDGVKEWAGKIVVPYTIQSQPGYSAYYLPALMHADYLDKIFVYPGIADIDKFHVVNFVFSPLKECEFTIYAGTPLLQVIPFKREDFHAECDKATLEESDKHFFNMPSRLKHYYRKFLYSRKEYTMKCPYEHRGPTND